MRNNLFISLRKSYSIKIIIKTKRKKSKLSINRQIGKKISFYQKNFNTFDSFSESKILRNNLSKLIVVLLLITIFSVQTFSTSESASLKQTKNTFSDVTPTKYNNEKIVTQNTVTSSSDYNNLRNLSISDLFDYLLVSYTTVSNSFIDSGKDHLDTTATVAKGLAILKMLGLTGYVIPVNNKTEIFKNFGSPIDGGYLVQQTVSNPSILGTYGVIESTELMNLTTSLSSIKTNAETFLMSKYIVFAGNQAGFKEDYQTSVNASIESTYYAVQALKTLGYQFNSSISGNIYNFLNSLWNGNGHFFSNRNDVDQSTILTSFQAISVLYDLNQTNQPLWNEINTGFPQFINSTQVKDGIFTGAISSTGNANVDDTGSALAALYILNKINQINVTTAVQFILQSQYNGSISGDKGGFSYNNSTQSSTSQFSGVTLTHTYYAILGLYVSRYLSNRSQFSIQTQYSTGNTFNNLNNEILYGQNSNFTAQINSLNYKNYYGELDLSINVTGLDVQYLKADTNSFQGSKFNYLIKNSSIDFSLGSHNLTAIYSLSNFNIVPVVNNVYKGSIIVRLPINNTINGISTSLEVSPGDLLTGEIGFDNNTVNATNLYNANLGNVSVHIIFPNGTSPSLNSSYVFPLVITNQSYLYNYNLPKNSPLGDYFVNLTYSNGTGTLFFTQQSFKVSTSVYLLGISSVRNYNLDPGSSFNLSFNIAYQNGFISPNMYNLSAHFLESSSQIDKFNVTLQYAGGNVFQANTSTTVPVGLFMGTYNVSLSFGWKSVITGNTLPQNSFNATLPLITYRGTPIIQNIDVSPISGRQTEKVLFSGDFLNITANVGVKNIVTSQVLLLSSINDLTAILYNTSNSKQTFQELSFLNLNNSRISVYGEINPNINLLNNVSLTLSMRVKYSSSNKFNLLYSNENNITKEYRPIFILKKANLELNQKFVNFVIGSSTITQNEFTTILVTFKVVSVDNNQTVAGLKLNASLVISTSGDKNETGISLPAVTSLDANNSYQIQIPVNNLAVGQYIVRVSPLNTQIIIGQFNFQIVPKVNHSTIPIENYIGLGTVALALIVSLIAYSIRKKN